jgi:aminopeptidase-like protein
MPLSVKFPDQQLAALAAAEGVHFTKDRLAQSHPDRKGQDYLRGTGTGRVATEHVVRGHGSLAPLAADSSIGKEIYHLAAEIFPICRSITGNGVRRTIDLLSRHVPFQRQEIPTGTAVLDWEIPKEWNITDAYIKNAQGERLVDFHRSNLHVLNYSAPVSGRMTLAELKPHIFTLPDQPDLIPYRTSYYQENWGFCMSHHQLAALEKAGGEYEVMIDSRLELGAMSWAEYLHAGETTDEVLLSAHVCHPSLANDNCSGVALLSILARELAKRRTQLSYRFLIAPGTIGSIAWLAKNEANLDKIKHGLIVSGVGDAGGPTYKRSRRGDALIDRAMTHVLRACGASPKVLEFFPYGYDERQYCSPGFDLPVGLFQRSQFATFAEYHTSADNLDFIHPEHLTASFRWIVQTLDILERDRCVVNLCPKGEPQLGRRGLYAAIGGDRDAWTQNMAMLWILNLADGRNSLLDIAERADLSFAVIASAAALLEEHGLLAQPCRPG